jgi:hypothetical protein
MAPLPTSERLAQYLVLLAKLGPHGTMRSGCGQKTAIPDGWVLAVGHNKPAQRRTKT